MKYGTYFSEVFQCWQSAGMHMMLLNVVVSEI